MPKIPKIPKIGAKLPVNLTATVNAAKEAAKSAIKASQANLKRSPSYQDWKKMSPAERKDYNRQIKSDVRMNRRTQRQGQRQARAAIKLGQASDMAVHQTIRQGLAELAGVGAEGVGSYAISKGVSSPTAIDQNVTGGLKPGYDEDQEDRTETGNGPLARLAKNGRKEE